MLKTLFWLKHCRSIYPLRLELDERVVQYNQRIFKVGLPLTLVCMCVWCYPRVSGLCVCVYGVTHE